MPKMAAMVHMHKGEKDCLAVGAGKDCQIDPHLRKVIGEMEEEY